MDEQLPLVLVVDDDRDVRFLCRVALELAGMDVIDAENGLAALQAARARRPDLILLDVYMPVMDGWACLDALRSDPSMNGVRIVVMTVKSEQGIDLKALQLGADDYVSKPFHPDGFVKAVQRTLVADASERESRRRSAMKQMERLLRL